MVKKTAQIFGSCCSYRTLQSWKFTFAKTFGIFSTIVGCFNMTLTCWMFELWNTWKKSQFQFLSLSFWLFFGSTSQFFCYSKTSSLYIGNEWDLTFQIAVGTVVCIFPVLSLFFILTDNSWRPLEVNSCLLSALLFMPWVRGKICL